MESANNYNTKDRFFSNRIKNLILVLCLFFLFIAIIGGLPYGYYTFLRIIIFASNIYLFVAALNKGKIGWCWAFGLIGLIFNPIFPLHLGREIWVTVDVLVSIFFFVSIFAFRLPLIKKVIRETKPINNKKMLEHNTVPVMSDISKELSYCQERLSKKEKEASELSVKIQDLKISLNIFLGEYNSRVGVLYVELDKIKLRIEEYSYRIDHAKGRTLTREDLGTIEEEVNEKFSKTREKVNDLENETTESTKDYYRHLEEEEKAPPFDRELQEELKKLFRKLALKFHPDMAKNDKQRKEYHKIFIDISEAYKNGDLETLRKYMKKVEREERMAKETPIEKLARLKEEYNTLLGIINKLQEELEVIRTSETYKLKVMVEEAKKEGRDLMQELAENIQREIDENQTILDDLIIQYKELTKGMSS